MVEGWTGQEAGAWSLLEASSPCKFGQIACLWTPIVPFFFFAYEGIDLLRCKAPLLTLWKSELLAVAIYNQKPERGCTVGTCKRGLRL